MSGLEAKVLALVTAGTCTVPEIEEKLQVSRSVVRKAVAALVRSRDLVKDASTVPYTFRLPAASLAPPPVDVVRPKSLAASGEAVVRVLERHTAYEVVGVRANGKACTLSHQLVPGTWQVVAPWAPTCYASLPEALAAVGIDTAGLVV